MSWYGFKLHGLILRTCDLESRALDSRFSRPNLEVLWMLELYLPRSGNSGPGKMCCEVGERLRMLLSIQLSPIWACTVSNYGILSPSCELTGGSSYRSHRRFLA